MVKVLGGTFDKGTKTFDVSEYDNIFAIRLEWAWSLFFIICLVFISRYLCLSWPIGQLQIFLF